MKENLEKSKLAAPAQVKTPVVPVAEPLPTMAKIPKMSTGPDVAAVNLKQLPEQPAAFNAPQWKDQTIRRNAANMLQLRSFFPRALAARSILGRIGSNPEARATIIEEAAKPKLGTRKAAAVGAGVSKKKDEQ
jgi:hypothetical protein